LRLGINPAHVKKAYLTRYAFPLEVTGAKILNLI